VASNTRGAGVGKAIVIKDDEEAANPGESSSILRVMKSASLRTEALKRSTAEVIEEPHSLR
jgi:hypothetical protein